MFKCRIKFFFFELHEYWCVFILIFKGEWSEERKTIAKTCEQTFEQASMEFAVHESRPQTHKKIIDKDEKGKKEQQRRQPFGRETKWSWQQICGFFLVLLCTFVVINISTLLQWQRLDTILFKAFICASSVRFFSLLVYCSPLSEIFFLISFCFSETF